MKKKKPVFSDAELENLIRDALISYHQAQEDSDPRNLPELTLDELAFFTKEKSAEFLKKLLEVKNKE